MAQFLQCKQCEQEFLASDGYLPSDDDDVIPYPICDRCGRPYICGICGDLFYPVVAEVDGVIFEGSADYCPPCDARECMPLEEEMALDALDR